MKCLTPYYLDARKVWSGEYERALFAASHNPDKYKKFPSRIPVACGSCIACRLKNRLIWTFRISEEVKDSDFVAFATMTYDAVHLPYTQHLDVDSGLMIEDLPTIVYKDFQTFKERYKKRLLRKYNVKLRYFCCGEYGGKTNRPHFHAIFFFKGSDHETTFLLRGFFRREFLDCWTLGSVLDFRDLSGEGAAGYCNKYMAKQLSFMPYEEQSKEKSLKSQLIGRGYIDRMKSWHLADPDNRCYAVYKGKKIPLPRSFAEKIFGWTKDKKEWSIIEQSYFDRLTQEEINVMLCQQNGSCYDLKPFYSPPELIEDMNHYYFEKFTKHDSL